MIRRTLFTVVVASFVSSVAFAQAGRDAAAKAIEANERAVITAVQKNDAKAFMNGVSADGFAIDGSGTMANAEFAKVIGQARIETWSIDQVKVTFLTDTTAIITYRLTGKGSFMGQPFPSPIYSSSTYVNRGGKWIAAFHQETAATPPPAPAKKK